MKRSILPLLSDALTRRSYLPLMTALLLACAVAAQAREIPALVGGPPPVPPGDCITPSERAQAEQNVARYHALFGYPQFGVTADPTPYPFHPQAGNLWDDLFIGNFVDLDPGPGIQDFDCKDWTYDGHNGHDSGLSSFAEQEIGVPVYAALDGVVVDLHDGEFDKNTKWQDDIRANYVILYHGGTHYSWYWHLRKFSVAVTLNQTVPAGTQLGLTGSSGFSSGPHLHFESHNEGKVYEPYAGSCRPGNSNWVSQIPVRRDTYLQSFNLSNALLENYVGLPHDLPRTGYYQTGNHLVGLWMVLLNLPARSNWTLRYYRPDGTLFFEGNGPFNNSADFRFSTWYIRYYLNMSVTGTWQLEMLINGKSLIKAPFQVVNVQSDMTNRPPYAVDAAFDPPAPRSADVVFCRLTVPIPADPDYDVVRYRYQWTLNGMVVRDVTTAAHSDALPARTGQPGDVLDCVVTPFDGKDYGPPAETTNLLDE